MVWCWVANDDGDNRGEDGGMKMSFSWNYKFDETGEIDFSLENQIWIDSVEFYLCKRECVWFSSIS